MSIQGLNVLIVGGTPTGGGAREHVLVQMACKSPAVSRVHYIGKNAPLMSMAKLVTLHGGTPEPTTLEELCLYAVDNHIDLAIIGNEDALAKGYADELRDQRNHGIRVFGPSSAAAAIESSKIYAKQIMRDAGVPTAAFQTFSDYTDAAKYIGSHKLPLVIKCDGLALGKGVVVCHTLDQAHKAAHDFLVSQTMGKAGKVILIEDFLVTHRDVPRAELSVLALVDMHGNIKLLKPAQDYKAVGNGDKGLNTGGMGSICPVPWVTQDMMRDIVEKIIRPTVDQLKRVGAPFSGVLYVGLMYTEEGWEVVEFNSRFGDPEIVAIYPLLRSDLIPVMYKVANGESIADETISWDENLCSVCVVVADENYPDGEKKPRRIRRDLFEHSNGVSVFAAGITRDDQGFVSTGGRILDIVGTGTCYDGARQIVDCHIAGKLTGSGTRYRSDIGAQYPRK